MLQGVVTCLCLVMPAVLGWLNEYDGPFHFQCPVNQFLSHINSIHNNHHEDRLWDFGCSPLPLTDPNSGNCHWTNYVNEYDEPLTYQCPEEGFITGIESMHSNHEEDRLFKFQCCSVEGAITHACYYTNWENEWDGLLDYVVPTEKILRGVTSYHDDGKEDRRFKFEICEIESV